MTEITKSSLLSDEEISELLIEWMKEIYSF